MLLLATNLEPATLGPIVSRPAIYALRLEGIASYYLLEGWTQANGEPHRGRRLTTAHKTLPMGSVRRLCRADRPLVCVIVTVTDRGPWIKGRDWDLSRAAARKLAMLTEGVVNVRVRIK